MVIRKANFDGDRDNFFADVDTLTGRILKIRYAYQINMLIQKRDLYDNEKPIVLPLAIMSINSNRMSYKK